VPLRLAKNPLANIGWAVNQYDAPVLALTQESNNLNVHKSDLIQVHEYANAVIVYLSPYVADIGRLNSTTEPQGCSVSVRLLFNPQQILDDAFSTNGENSTNLPGSSNPGLAADSCSN
jgi:hypothetical protein